MRISVDILHLCSECWARTPTTAILHILIYLSDKQASLSSGIQPVQYEK
jgi:hypothetical protein